MAEAVLSSVIGDMVSRAISLVVGHTAGRLGTEAKLERVRYMLIKIESVVEEAKGRQITNHGTLTWLSELIDCMYQGRYLLDVSGNGSIELIDNNKVLTHPHPFLLSSFNPAKRFRVAASTIKSLFSHDHSLEEINSVVENLQSMSYDLREFIMLLGSCPPIRKPVSTNLYVDCQMFGRHVERERVINFLLHGNNFSDRKLDILPIIGHVGVGKTTLVQHVCDDARVRSRFSPIMLFDFFSLCPVVSSERSNSEIMATLRSKYTTGHLGNFSELLHVLKHKLHNKRFLMVFEDVDLHNKQMLDVLLSHLNGGKQGSKIIVTGNNNQIVSIGTVPPMKLRILPHAEYWFHFKALAFPGADLEENCPRLVTIGKAIAKRLNGSFFGAKIIGALLRARPNYSFWCMALRSSIGELPVLGSSLTYISEVSNYFLSRHLTMCHVNAYTSRPDRTLSSLQDVCLASPHIDENNLVDHHGNSLNLHVLLCKSILPFYSVHYVAHCHLGANDGCGSFELFNNYQIL